jgi:hypothetical protein
MVRTKPILKESGMKLSERRRIMTREEYDSAFQAGYEKARQERSDSAYMSFVKDVESDGKHKVIGNTVYEITSYGLKNIGAWLG